MSIRTERVARMIQREVAELLQHDFHEASQSLITVTNARVTADLGIAYVNVSVLGDTPEARKAAFNRLDAETVAIRKALAARIRHQVRRIPELRFFLDEGPQKRAHMDDLFAKIREEREGRDASGETEEETDAPARGDY
ncbi:30S ribosome-binding factor RbfA [Rubricoccus marinus]|uniref:Ribosome-binding factor A n=1 Tax=Rubricoccus marinus TaxID=716817 RepID=A0A259TXR8_9BACT|nr:30S ribosome-binding factor RbfA [Rubricoccus marinus]OZC02565.1 ribosome-binding factor A [Rubricoccus marinus]